MTKREIYEQVVRLTSEIAETKIAQKIFDAAMYGDVEKTDMIINAFPYYYPELYKRIVSFAIEFDKLVEKPKEDYVRIGSRCESFMKRLMDTGIIGQVDEVVDTEDAAKLQEVIIDFKQKSPRLVKKLVEFQKEFNQIRDNQHAEYEWGIFGTKADEKNGVFVFDTNIIDALSFYVLTILARVRANDFFYDKEVEENGEIFTVTDNEDFVDAIEKATNEAFAVFVENFNIDYCSDEDQEYYSVGETLVDAWRGYFEEF